ncbi:MAG: hypothetical protein ACRYG8_55185 [Janthinobacterium lividum]
MDDVAFHLPEARPLNTVEARCFPPAARDWDVLHVPNAARRHDHLERLLDLGWEPYGSDHLGQHFRRRTRRITCAVVLAVGAVRAKQPVVRDLFRGWVVIPAMTEDGPLFRQPTLMFDRIVMIWKPENQKARAWLTKHVMSRLIPPAKLEYV